ncbi:hypothetical protein D3C71_1456800 [compost metagenome]
MLRQASWQAKRGKPCEQLREAGVGGVQGCLADLGEGLHRREGVGRHQALLVGAIDVATEGVHQAEHAALLAVGGHFQQGLGLQFVDPVIERPLLRLHGLAQRQPAVDGALQRREVIAQALKQLQLLGEHLARFIDAATLLQGAQQAFELTEDAGDMRLAGVVAEHPVGDALGAQVFDQVVDQANFRELFRAGDGVVERAPAADRSGQGKQQDHSEAKGELGGDTDVAEPAVEIAEHGESPSD